MQKKQILKSLLAVSTVAAMLGSFGVQAQTAQTTQSGQNSQQMSQHGSQGNPNLTGKAANDGAMHNADSKGMQDRGTQSGSSSTATTQSGSSNTAMGATAAGTAKLSKADKKALTDMALSNMAEIEAAKLALSKTQDQEVRTFAQQMIDDHTKAQNEVQAVAQAKGVELPTELDAKHKAMANRLEKLSGDAFDRAYMKQSGLADHKATHAKLKKGINNAKDPDVKALAAKMSPVVEQHLKSAQQLTNSHSHTATGKSGTTGKTDSGNK